MNPPFRPPRSGFAMLMRGLLYFVVIVFVLIGLVFATCLLMVR